MRGARQRRQGALAAPGAAGGPSPRAWRRTCAMRSLSSLSSLFSASSSRHLPSSAWILLAYAFFSVSSCAGSRAAIRAAAAQQSQARVEEQPASQRRPCPADRRTESCMGQPATCPPPPAESTAPCMTGGCRCGACAAFLPCADGSPDEEVQTGGMPFPAPLSSRAPSRAIGGHAVQGQRRARGPPAPVSPARGYLARSPSTPPTPSPPSACWPPRILLQPEPCCCCRPPSGPPQQVGDAAAKCRWPRVLAHGWTPGKLATPTKRAPARRGRTRSGQSLIPFCRVSAARCLAPIERSANGHIDLLKLHLRIQQGPALISEVRPPPPGADFPAAAVRERCIQAFIKSPIAFSPAPPSLSGKFAACLDMRARRPTDRPDATTRARLPRRPAAPEPASAS
jgi:hypothetical protein